MQLMTYFFTFGSDSVFAKRFVGVAVDQGKNNTDPSKFMFDHFTNKWAFQYKGDDLERQVTMWGLRPLICVHINSIGEINELSPDFFMRLAYNEGEAKKAKASG